jgi:hypothetical protein
VAFAYALDPATPPGGESASLGDDRIRELKNAIVERVNSRFVNIEADPWIIKSPTVGTGNTQNLVPIADNIYVLGTAALRFSDLRSVLATFTSVTGTLLTVAQPNITSVGTLTALTVTPGTSSMQAITGTTLTLTGTLNGVAGQFSGNLTAVAGLFSSTVSATAFVSSSAGAQVLSWQRTGGTAKSWQLNTDDAGFSFRNATDGLNAVIVTNAGAWTFLAGVTGTSLTVSGSSTLQATTVTALTASGVSSLQSVTATTVTATGLILTAASATGGAGFRLPHGAAPSAPVDGDLWTTTGGIHARINGITTTLAATGSVDAGTLTGVTLAAGVVNSSLTSVGTLTSLNSSGNINAGSYTINGLTAAPGWYLAQNTRGLLVQNSSGSNKVAITLDASNVWQFGDGLLVMFNAGLTVSAGTTAVQALTTTTIAATGVISTSVTNNSFSASGATTNPRYIELVNDGSSLRMGAESSTGGSILTGSSAYDAVIKTSHNVNLRFGVNNVLAATLAPGGALTLVGGLAATTGTFSGALTATTGAFTANNAVITTTSATGTATHYFIMSNTGSSIILGVESSLGGALLTGSSAYDAVFKNSNNVNLRIGLNNVLVATFAPGGGLTLVGGLTAVGLSSSSGLTISSGVSSLQGITGSTLTLTDTLTGVAANLSGGLQVGGGATVAKWLTTTLTWNPASVGAQSSQVTTVTLTGAAVGDLALVVNEFLTDNTALVTTAHVSAADTVRVCIANPTAFASDPASRTLRIFVLKF